MPNTDPFLGLYNTIKEATAIPSSMFIGVVSNGLPNLKIKFEGIELDKDDFLIDKWLVDRNNNINTLEANAHTHKIESPVKNVLSVGDKVLLVKVNNTYIVLSKVVSL